MNRRILAALLALLTTAPSGAFAGFEKEALPGTVSAPVLPAMPSAVTPAAIQAPIPSAGPAGVAALSAAVAPQLQAIAQPSASSESSSRAGESAARILQGGRAEPGASSVDAGAAPQEAAAPLAASAPAPSRDGQPPAPPSAPKGPAAVDGRRAYALRRAVLSLVSSVFGVSYSLPPAGPRLTREILKQASGREFVFSDFDYTLDGHNAVLGSDGAAAIVALRKAGKRLAVVTTRSYVFSGGLISAFDSLSSIPPAERAGIIVATNSGAKIFEYGADGEPKLLYEEPPLSVAQALAIKSAAEAVKARLSSFGAAFEKEYQDDFSYSMLLQKGVSEAGVRAAAAELQEGLRQRGLDYEVSARIPNNPNHSPYIGFKTVDKSSAVRRIAELKGVSASQALILGDSMYAPKTNEALGRLGRAVVARVDKLAGPLPLVGDEADRKMEKALPGALTLSVGGTADAAMKNAYVLETKGPSMTRRVLEAVASRPAKAVVAEHRALLKERDFHSRWIAQTGVDLSRAGREFWARLLSDREELDRKIADLEERFPSLKRR